MAVDNNAIAVGDVATPLDLTNDAGDTMAGESWAAYNDGNVRVFIGGPGVTATGAKKGIPVDPSTWAPAFDLNTGDRLFGICAAGLSTSVIVIESGV